MGTENGIPYVIGANGDKISMNDVSVHNRSLGLDILHYSGTTIPPHTFGWSNQFTWNNFSLYVYLTGNFGGIFRAPTAGSIPSVGSGKLLSVVLLRILLIVMVLYILLGLLKMNLILFMGSLYSEFRIFCSRCFFYSFERNQFRI